MSHDLPLHVEIAKVPDPATVRHVTLEASVCVLVGAHPEDALPPWASAAARCAERLLGHAYKLNLLLASWRHPAENGDSAGFATKRKLGGKP